MHSVSMARRLAGDRAAQISFLPCETLPAIPHDPIQLQHALLSVLMNGVRAGSEHGEVHLTIAQHDGFAMTFVEDSGPATSPGELEKMFRPFPGGRRKKLRVSPTHCKTDRGSARRAGGWKRESAQGRGTTISSGCPSAETALKANMASGKILIVDDEKLLRWSLAPEVQTGRLLPIEAENGVDASADD